MSYSIVASTTTVDEGGTVQFDVATSLFNNGTLYYSVLPSTNTLNNLDFYPTNVFSGAITITNGTASFSLTLAEDRLSERKVEKFKVELRTGAESGENSAVVAITSEITVRDTSQTIGGNSRNKTFGPIIVNRDENIEANITDWYTVCNLDQVPDGSKIAIFLDKSGTIGDNTVKASYDRLISKLNDRNISVITVTNSNEDWITPFLVDLP
tara:strand:+ start:75 stop:707 length:633 start_codon:yes stop_codon:yes gene_type:complete